ncbi:MAG: hypothetical protein WA734_04275 [Candidatus Acidiferrales bacterium]
MRKLWNGIVHTLFWSYDRGSWPYDVMVVAILIFVLLTPRKWFADQPQTSVAAAQGEAMIQRIAENDVPGTRTYRLSAAILAPNKRAHKPTPELEAETHEILGGSVEELKGQTFQVLQIDPVQGEDGSVQYYDVRIKF